MIRPLCFELEYLLFGPVHKFFLTTAGDDGEKELKEEVLSDIFMTGGGEGWMTIGLALTEYRAAALHKHRA